MKRLIQSDLTKILIFIILTSSIAALLCPWLYNAGKMIAEVAATRTDSEKISWLTQQFANASFVDFFHAALALSGFILAGPFIMWMQLGNTPHQSILPPWRIKLPRSSQAYETGQALKHNKRGWLHIGTGILIASSLTLLMMWLLIYTKWFNMNHPVMWWEAIQNALFPAALSAITLEWLFRGFLQGICLRSMRPSLAIILASSIFAIIHLLLPTHGTQPLNPEKWDAGVQMFSMMGKRLLQPADITLPFLTLFSIGIILAYARLRTASLWLPIGLHFGWLYTHRIFDQISTLNGEHLAAAQLFISAERTTGFLPLSLLIATALLVHTFAQISEEKRQIKKDVNIPPSS